MPEITFTLLDLTNFSLNHKKNGQNFSEFVQNSGEFHQMMVLPLVKIFGKSSTVDLASASILSSDEG